MTPAGIPVMARVVAPLLAEPFGRPMMFALFCHRSFASKPIKPAKVVAPKKIKQVKPPKKKGAISRAQMLYMENNLLFGKLLETSKEKRKRFKNDITTDADVSLPVEKPMEDYSKEWELKRALKYHPDRVTVRYTEPSKDAHSPSDDTSKPPTNITASTPMNSVTREDSKSNDSSCQDESVIRIASSVVPVSFPYSSNNAKSKLPSVTRILRDTMPPEQKALLDRWEKNMREKLGDEGFRLHKEGILNNGRDLHANIREILSGTPEDHLFIPERIEGHWRSLRSVLAGMKQVHALESHVAHSSLEYCGIVDCIAQFRDKLVLVDWKTSEKPKPVVAMTYDTPLQIAAYIGAVNEDPNYSIKIRAGLIVVAYQNGNICETFFLTEKDVAVAWDKWMKRLNQYRQQEETSGASIKSE